MPFIIRVYYNDKICSMDISGEKVATIGSAAEDTMRLDSIGLRGGHVKFKRSGYKVSIKGKDILKSDGTCIKSETLAVGNRYTIGCEPPLSISVHPKQNGMPKNIRLCENKDITLGRNSDNDIVLSNSRTSKYHCKFYSDGKNFIIKDLNSKNGVYVNGSRVGEAVLKNADVINISIYHMAYQEGILSVHNIGEDLTLNMEEYVGTVEIPDFEDGLTVRLFGGR